MNKIDTEALNFHSEFPAGKIGIEPTKDVVKNISLAYSPGVAAPCLEINLNPASAAKYTNIKNSVAIISNGTAVLGLGKIGALASKPVMEGKAALFKVLGGIDCIDIEIEERDPAKLVEYIASIATTFGGINLEDIAAPECFEIETNLKSSLKIPVFHDDQHGTAIVVTAAVINWAKLYDKSLEDIKVVALGAGACGIACAKLLKLVGVNNIVMLDSKGVIHVNRDDLNDYKAEFAVQEEISLEEALKGADVFLGSSVANALKPDAIKQMAKNPLILALANPVPEINPADALAARSDAVVCTGRSDFDNQVNNVLCFPYLFRVSLDHDLEINDHLKLATARSIADLARLSDDFGPKAIVPKTASKSIKYIMPGLIMHNLASEINLNEYSRNFARRLLPHSHHVFNMVPNHLMQHVRFGGQNSIEAISILSAWGYSTTQVTMQEFAVRDYANALFLFINKGKYQILHSGNANNLINTLKSKLNIQFAYPTNATRIESESLVGIIENYESNATYHYNQLIDPDELALFSIICSNVSGNALS